MQQFAPVFVAIVFVISLSAKSEAKRGCALYGHACYGGHGKRADIQPSLLNNEDQPVLNRINAINKEVIGFSTNNVRGPNDNVLYERPDHELQFAVYDLLKQMMENARRARETNADIAAEDAYKMNNI